MDECSFCKGPRCECGGIFSVSPLTPPLLSWLPIKRPAKQTLEFVADDDAVKDTDQQTYLEYLESLGDVGISLDLTLDWNKPVPQQYQAISVDTYKWRCGDCLPGNDQEQEPFTVGEEAIATCKFCGAQFTTQQIINDLSYDVTAHWVRLEN